MKTSKKLEYNENSLKFLDGIKDGFPISIGYIPIAITFGILAKSYGIPNHIIILMSLIIFAGSSQFIGIKLISLGTPHPEIIFTTFIINFRNFLMSSALSQRIEPSIPKKLKALIAYGVTDETFAIASSRKEEKINARYLIGLHGLLFTSFNFGTFIGTYLISNLSGSIKNSLGIAIYAMFLSILIPSIKKSKKILMISLMAVIISSLLTYMPFIKVISTGWIIIIATIISSSIGALIFPKEVESDG